MIRLTTMMMAVIGYSISIPLSQAQMKAFSNGFVVEEAKTSNPEIKDTPLSNKERKLLDMGDGYFHKGYSFYDKALNYYLQAYEKNPYNAELNYQIGLTYELKNELMKALPYYEMANILNNSLKTITLQSIAKAYHEDYQFEKAIELYEEYIDIIRKEARSKKFAQITIDEMRLKIWQCENARDGNLINKKVVIIE